MKKSLRALLAALSLLLAAALLVSCSRFPSGNTGLPHPSDVTTSVTTGNSTVTNPSEDLLTDSELSAFLSYVDVDKVSIVDVYYQHYYIGGYRSVNTCYSEIYEMLRAIPELRGVTDVETATSVFVAAYARVLGDNYGYYYSPTDYDEYEADLDGKYVGVGVSVTVDEKGYAELLAVFAGSPAEEAGLLPGDRIVAVNGEDFAVVGYQNALNIIRGEVGTYVTLTVERDGVRTDYTMPRRAVSEETVEYRMMDGNVGYIRILSFNDVTYMQFVAAHRALEDAGAEAYVFDLRNNPGGTLTSVISVLEYILPDGRIVELNYKHSYNDLVVSSIWDYSPAYITSGGREYYEGHQIDKPMVVLANGRTASAGELFTSSLQDYGVAPVIGEKTYGKGVGQTSISIGNDGSALVFTVFSYDPPSQPNYDGIGITPDMLVSLPEELKNTNLYKLTYDEDTQLQAAMATLGVSSPQ